MKRDRRVTPNGETKRDSNPRTTALGIRFGGFISARDPDARRLARGIIKRAITTDNFIRPRSSRAGCERNYGTRRGRLRTYYITSVYSGDAPGSLNAHTRQTTAGRSKMHRRRNGKVARCAVPRCNVLTVSQRRAISRLIATRKRPAVSNVPRCLARRSIGLCAVYARARANFVAGQRLIANPRRHGRSSRLIFTDDERPGTRNASLGDRVISD